MTTYSLPLVRRKHPDRVRPPRDPLLIASASVLGLIVAVAVVAAVVPFAGDPQRIVGPRLSAPTTLFPLGTDALGRSLLPRLLEGIGTTL
ncbi:ABC transporter permease, partial [Leucobacter sp. OLES1]